MSEQDEAQYQVHIRCRCGFWREWTGNLEDAGAVLEGWVTDHARCGGNSSGIEPAK